MYKIVANFMHFKMNSWSGSVEIGVTECDPTTLEFPACASKLQNGSWVNLTIIR